MRLFVGNLSWSVDGQALKELFGTVGNVVDARVIKERDSGRSRGFGFVTFEFAEEAEKAVSEFQGYELSGRPLRIDRAIERQDPRKATPAD